MNNEYVQFLKQNFYFRVSGSKYGAGLFAVRDIPKGTKMIAGHPPGTKIPYKGKNGSSGVKEYNKSKKNKRPYKIFELLKLGLTKRQVQLMQDFVCRGYDKKEVPLPQPRDVFYPPPYQFSNHSDKPNTKQVGHYLVALRKIKNGEELTHDYRVTCDNPYEHIKN